MEWVGLDMYDIRLTRCIDSEMQNDLLSIFMFKMNCDAFFFKQIKKEVQVLVKKVKTWRKIVNLKGDGDVIISLSSIHRRIFSASLHPGSSTYCISINSPVQSPPHFPSNIAIAFSTLL